MRTRPPAETRPRRPEPRRSACARRHGSWGSLNRDDHHRHAQRRDRQVAVGAELPARPPPPHRRPAHDGRRQGRERRAHPEGAPPAGDRHGASPAEQPARTSSSNSPRSQSSTTSSASATSPAPTPPCSTQPPASRPRSTSVGPPSPRTRRSCSATSCSTWRAVPRSWYSPDRCRAACHHDLYASLIRDLAKARTSRHGALDTDGEPLRHAVRAEPDVISPNGSRRRSWSATSSTTNDDRPRAAVREMVSLGAREAIMTLPDGCLAQVLVDGSPPVLYRVHIPPARARRGRSGRAMRSWRATCRRATAAARPAECLCFGVACGAESTAAPGRRADRSARGAAADGRRRALRDRAARRGWLSAGEGKLGVGGEFACARAWVGRPSAGSISVRPARRGCRARVLVWARLRPPETRPRRGHDNRLGWRLRA